MDEDKSFALELLEMQGVYMRNLITAVAAVAVAAIVGLATVVGIFIWYLKIITVNNFEEANLKSSKRLHRGP